MRRSPDPRGRASPGSPTRTRAARCSRLDDFYKRRRRPDAAPDRPTAPTPASSTGTTRDSWHARRRAWRAIERLCRDGPGRGAGLRHRRTTAASGTPRRRPRRRADVFVAEGIFAQEVVAGLRASADLLRRGATAVRQHAAGHLRRAARPATCASTASRRSCCVRRGWALMRDQQRVVERRGRARLRAGRARRGGRPRSRRWPQPATTPGPGRTRPRPGTTPGRPPRPRRGRQPSLRRPTTLPAPPAGLVVPVRAPLAAASGRAPRRPSRRVARPRRDVRTAGRARPATRPADGGRRPAARRACAATWCRRAAATLRGERAAPAAPTSSRCGRHRPAGCVDDGALGEPARGAPRRACSAARGRARAHQRGAAPRLLVTAARRPAREPAARPVVSTPDVASDGMSLATRSATWPTAPSDPAHVLGHGAGDRIDARAPRFRHGAGRRARYAVGGPTAGGHAVRQPAQRRARRSRA